MTTVRIATRASRLALAQARWVGDRLTAADPSATVDIVEVTTTGDADRVSPVTTLTEVGAFVRAVQQAVLTGAADVAVHSCKDLPVTGPAGLAQVFPVRESPWDVLCGSTLADLPTGARVGTGSPRRSAQLSAIRPDLRIDGIRGNVDTRLGKVAAGEYDAVVLAEAGLNRLGRQSDIAERFELDRMVPAPAQGALAVEVRDDGELVDLAAEIDDDVTRSAVGAERSLLALTGAGCRAALGAYAWRTGDEVSMAGFVEDEHGSRTATVTAADPDLVARSLKEALQL